MGFESHFVPHCSQYYPDIIVLINQLATNITRTYVLTTWAGEHALSTCTIYVYMC